MASLLEPLKASLASRYAIKKELGAGGMATVFLAQDLRHEREVAVKVLHPDLAQSLGTERFLREIRTAANFMHPHIVPLFDSGEAEGLLFFVMPFLKGESLQERLKRDGQLPVDEAVAIVRDVGDALAAAHDRGIVHRDIKPGNILLDGGHAFVADFGIALAVDAAGEDRLTRTGHAPGTPAYMSPEQIAGDEKIDGRSDLYALACVLFEMLAGEPPFTGPNTRAILSKHLAAPVPSISTVRHSVPRHVAKTVERALAKSPADRFPSVRAFCEALLGEAELLEERSVAVLPFANLSPDPENEFLSDGITEEIINALGRLRNLKVAARTSSFTFKGATPDIRDVGARLNVQNVLEGSVRKAGNRLRITAQLVDVEAGFHLWSERFDREMDDIFQVQDEIAAAVVDRLRVSLIGASEVGARPDHTDNLQAYEMYLRGRYFWKQRGVGVQKGFGYLKKAVELDPGYALAHAGLADAFAMIGFWNGIKRLDAYPEGKAAAHRALQLDPSLAEPHACLGFIAIYHDWDWTAAEEHLLRAIEMNPRYMEAHLWYSQLLGWVRGDHDAAIRTLQHAHELDPLSAMVLAQMASHLIHAGRVEEALQEVEKAIELAPGLGNSYMYRAWAHRKTGDYEKTLEGLKEAMVITKGQPGQPYLLYEFAITHAWAGHPERARTVLDESVLPAEKPACTAFIYGAIGEMDTALEWVEKAFALRDPDLAIFRSPMDVFIDEDAPLFRDILRRLRLA